MTQTPMLLTSSRRKGLEGISQCCMRLACAGQRISPAVDQLVTYASASKSADHMRADSMYPFQRYRATPKATCLEHRV